MVMLPDASAPPGLRLYAIGDVHGRADLLADMHQRIECDLAARPVADWRVIYVGDYVDRGPQSAEVLQHLIDRSDDGHSEFLLGNHDLFLRDFLTDPESADFDMWIVNGGIKTIDSFGVDGMMMAYAPEPDALARLRDAMAAEMPPEMPDFLAGLHLMRRHGDYVFVHAGIRPGLALDQQVEQDLIWIREPFLSSDEDHGAVVVHGHTPLDAVEVRPNRIGIDTGAVFTGNLTCLVLEGTERALLGPERLEDLPFVDR